MRQVLSILLLGFISGFAIASNEYKFNTSIHFVNLTPNIQTVYYGEQAAISLVMHYTNLNLKQVWQFPANVGLQIHSFFSCPPFISGPVNLRGGDCYFSLIINGDQLGRVINGFGMYYLHSQHKGNYWDVIIDLPFSVTVIPHPLSMANIPLLNATANLPVYVDLRPYVNYYYENTLAGAWPVAEMFPSKLDGLYYDPRSFAIVGTPTRAGIYQFNVVVGNVYGKAMATNLTFEVGVNKRDKPVFKTNYTFASAMPRQTYQLNLMELIEPRVSFVQNNPVRFRIDSNESHPDWLRVGGNGNTLLMGQIPASDAGTTKEATIIASSNAGGDSEPFKIHIPIATDPASRPEITLFSLEKPVGIEFEYDVRKHISDPANDDSLRLIIDKVEPAAPWLQLSPTNRTALFGTVPLDATGQEYQLSLHANTRIGGNSDEIKVLLSVAVDKEKQPRFKAANPQLPVVYPGAPFEHDFAANSDIFPDYEEAPYVVELAADYDNPPWLRIENNKLIADLVPKELTEQIYQIYLTIKNIPGGKSEVISLMLFAMI